MASTKFTEDYIEKCFYAWYESGKRIIIDKLPDNEDRGKPIRTTVENWITSYGWVERADALDAEASSILDKEAIEKRRLMFIEAVEVSDELIKKGRDFLTDRGIQTSADAIRAIDLGLTTKLRSVGAAEMYDKISKMSNEQLSKELQKLIGKKDESVDAETEIIEDE